MDLEIILLLVAVGLLTGFVASLIGIGGGVLFTPVLLYTFEALGFAPDLVPKLTIGSGLFCTFVVALASGYFQWKRGAVAPRVALTVGLLSIVAVFLTTRFVTTQPWYDAQVFRLVFGVVLAMVALRMLWGRPGEVQAAADVRARYGLLGGIGSAAGTLSAAAGVGGGVILVPAYSNLLRLPLTKAVGTSSATIVLIAGAGVLMNMALGWGTQAAPYAVGYVDFGHALPLALPALLSARLGVKAAHKVNRTVLRKGFAVFAILVAVRLLLKGLEVI